MRSTQFNFLCKIEREGSSTIRDAACLCRCVCVAGRTSNRPYILQPAGLSTARQSQREMG